jgi:fructose-1,6-bisphosphatase I
VLYEAAPLAFIAEEAGGAASDGHRRIMDIVPTSLHERTPLFLGSAEDVRECEEFIQERHPALTADRRNPAHVRAKL